MHRRISILVVLAADASHARAPLATSTSRFLHQSAYATIQ